MAQDVPVALLAENLGRRFEVVHKAEGLIAGVRNFFHPVYETVRAVHDFFLKIHSGEIIGFLGPNGAGKTTTLKMCSGLIAPTEGKLTVLGFDPFQRHPDFLKSISLVMGQKQNLWWDLPPIEAFAIHREMYEIPAAEYRRRVDELVDMLQISDCIEIQTRKLSLGQRMRCELGLALLHQPRMLFLDEPTIGLDILMQKRIRQFLLEYHARFQPTIILTSHYMEDVAALAQRVVVINRGSKVFDGPLKKLTSEARSDKILTVTFGTVPAGFAPDRFGTLLHHEGSRFRIKITRQSTAECASSLFATGEVRDLTIEEPPLEDAISHLFAGDFTAPGLYDGIGGLTGPDGTPSNSPPES